MQTARLTALTAALACSQGAIAQEMHFSLSASQTEVGPDDPTITIDVEVSWDGDFVGFAAALLDLLGVQNWETGQVTDYGGEFFDGGIFGDDEGQLLANNDIVNIMPGQLPPFFNGDFDASKPLLIFSVEWETTDFTEREVCVDVVPYEGYVYVDEFGATATMNPVGDSLCFDVGSGNCPGDFNGDGTKDTRDVLAFLQAWAAGDRRADWNGDGRIDTRDVLLFLNDWIAAC